jgi:hypothetical protein
MKCPHCLIDFHEHWQVTYLGNDSEAGWKLAQTRCSACEKFVFDLMGESAGGEAGEWRIWPRAASRPIPPEVPEPYAGNFREACLVLPDSTNASAAISRRCLQSLLVNEGEAKKGRLEDQIKEVVASKQLRPQLADNLHYVRKVGNLAAHETKNKHTGEVVDATQEEAEWLIEVIEGMFDHYFVEPRREQDRREKFDARIAEAKGQPAASKSDERNIVPNRTSLPLGQGESTQVDRE